MKFEELKLSNNVKRALSDIGHLETTQIQLETIPEILKGGDIIGQSQTGTGKTAAFGLPIIEMINPEIRDTQSIVLCPTRELAVQVSEEIRKYTKYLENIKIIAIYGGQGIEKQIMDLKRGAQVVIGTPGRVMDHMRRKTLKLDKVKMIVLDEADEMLNMGFEEDIITILKDIPEERQTILFSATMNPRILRITKKYLRNPKHIKIKAEELTVQNIEQLYVEMKQGMKDESLTRLIDVYKPRRAIVFCNTKRKVDDVIDMLKIRGYKAEALHGDVKQIQRDRIMKKLKGGDFQILVATDVVARGIDIEDLDLVINYDVPKEEEYYVHRIGRTGRNGNEGKSFTFVVGKERIKLNSIQKYANTKIKEGKIPTITEINKLRNAEMINKIQKVIDENKYENSELLEELLAQNNDIKKVASALLSMVIKPKIEVKKDIEQMREKRRDKDTGNRDRVSKDRDHKTKGNTEEGYVKLFFNLGKMDNIAVKDIIGSITANAAVSGSDIGKVNLLDKFSFVEVPEDLVEEVMNGMKGKQIKGRDVNIEVANN